MKKATPFLMFQGNAEEALNFYTSIIDEAEIINMVRYRGSGDTEGSSLQATLSIKGQEFMCLDSKIKHEFDFTPSFSIYITCEDEGEINSLFEKLTAGGIVLMPLQQYDFSKRFAWVQDKFGVSWQLDLPN